MSEETTEIVIKSCLVMLIIAAVLVTVFGSLSDVAIFSCLFAASAMVSLFFASE